MPRFTAVSYLSDLAYCITFCPASSRPEAASHHGSCTTPLSTGSSRVAQWKRAGPITQRSVDRNYALLATISFSCLLLKHCPAETERAGELFAPISAWASPFTMQLEQKQKSSLQGAHGVEPWTYRSAVDCSTTELYTQTCLSQQASLHFSASMQGLAPQSIGRLQKG